MVDERLVLTPIGIARTPFRERVEAPRQASVARDVEGSIELLPGRDFEHALEDLAAFSHAWVLFWFHLNAGWRPKVLPPRSAGRRRGVFATRSPHRPNPLGLSLVRVVSVEGLVVRVKDIDLVDGTPVLDLKPYVPYADAAPGATSGWLDAPATAVGAAPLDPRPAWSIVWSDLAREQARWLRDAHGVDLVAPAERTLSLGPHPHPYRRIRPEGDAFVLAVKDWRLRFSVSGAVVTVVHVRTGYRETQLAGRDDPALAPHRELVARFGSNSG